VISASSLGLSSLLVSSPIKFETLEARLFLHGDGSALLALGVPAEMIRDGHISHADFMTLTDAQRAQIDPHHVESPLGADGPVDFDALLGLPLSVTAPDAGTNDTFPDWFPSLNGGGISLNQTSQPGRALIQFPSGIHNQGTGPGLAISGRPGVDPIPTGAPITSWLNPDGSHAILQPIYSFNGSSFTLSHYRSAGSFTYHPGHGHFHFDGYGYYRLRHSVGGQPGDYVQRPDGTGIIGEKLGFCLINTGSVFTMENGQPSNTLPGYNAPGQPSPGCGLLQGVHVGKTDGYGVGTSGQWLDVTGVPNGQYFLEIKLDGENAMMETNEANNAKTFPFTLNANPPAGGIPRDDFDQPGSNNDTLASAADMQVMGTYTRAGLTIHWGQDHDWFKFTASSTGTYSVSSTFVNGNIDLYLYDANGTQIGASTGSESGTTTTPRTETINYNFVEGQTYYAQVRTYNSTTSSNYQVAWNLKPLATSTSPAPVAMEGGAVGTFRIARNGPLESPLDLSFTLGGTAVNGVDYQAVATSLTMGNLDSFVDVEIIPIDDNLIEGRETVTLTLNTSSAYVVGATGSVVAIADNDLGRSRLSNTSLHGLPTSPFSDRRLTGDSSDDDVVTALLA
jgi:hypothetical protein